MPCSREEIISGEVQHCLWWRHPLWRGICEDSWPNQSPLPDILWSKQQMCFGALTVSDLGHRGGRLGSLLGHPAESRCEHPRACAWPCFVVCWTSWEKKKENTVRTLTLCCPGPILHPAAWRACSQCWSVQPRLTSVLQ